jgi:chaperone BCS1
MEFLRDFISEGHRRYVAHKKNSLGDELYYFDTIHDELTNRPGCITFQQNKFETNKNLSNIYLVRKKEMLTRLDTFINHKEWYQVNGLPHTFGMLLHGEPGCGKTSTIKAVANRLSRHIVNINLLNLTSNAQLKHLFYNDYLNVRRDDGRMELIYVPIYKRVYVLEDIDCMGSNIVFDRSADIPSPNLNARQGGRRLAANSTAEPMNQTPMDISSERYYAETEDTATSFLTSIETNPTPTDDITLSSLLNIMDGTLEIPGRVMILTTNNPEKLDTALVRPGRIDMNIEFTCATRDMIIEMYENFFQQPFPNDYKTSIKHNILSPAEVIQMMFKHTEAPLESMSDLCVEQDVSPDLIE